MNASPNKIPAFLNLDAVSATGSKRSPSDLDAAGERQSLAFKEVMFGRVPDQTTRQPEAADGPQAEQSAGGGHETSAKHNESRVADSDNKPDEADESSPSNADAADNDATPTTDSASANETPTASSNEKSANKTPTAAVDKVNKTPTETDPVLGSKVESLSGIDPGTADTTVGDGVMHMAQSGLHRWGTYPPSQTRETLSNGKPSSAFVQGGESTTTNGGVVSADAIELHETAGFSSELGAAAPSSNAVAAAVGDDLTELLDRKVTNPDGVFQTLLKLTSKQELKTDLEALQAVDAETGLNSTDSQVKTVVHPALQSYQLGDKSAAIQTGVQTPVGDVKWQAAINERILWMAAQNVSSAEIHLDPPELGPLQVRISVSGEQTQVTFTSQHAAVREALDLGAHRLREMLEDQGLNSVNVDVSDQSFAERHSGDDTGESKNGQSGTESREEAGVITDLSKNQGLVDSYV